MILRSTISENRITNRENDKKLNGVLGKIKEAKDKKDDLLGKRYSIDDEIKKVNPTILKKEIDELTKKGVSLKEDLEGILKEIKEVTQVLL